MEDFRLDDGIVTTLLHSARERASTPIVRQIVAQARRGHGLAVEDMAALWFAPDLTEEDLYQLAHEARGAPLLETFSPLYMTNTCDAECRMCGMRRDNQALVRETATLEAVEEQLHLLSRRGMRAVALLTGEYHTGTGTRAWALAFVNEALKSTQALGFNHVLINIGALDDDEFPTLLAGVDRRADGAVRPKLTMCTFQESYSRRHYAKFMGTSSDNPRADYDRRLVNFDRAFRAGMRVANPGILVGLNPNLGYELAALALHSRHLRARGMEVYLSVPRLRQIAGSQAQRGASDAEFVRLVSLLSLGLPDCKVVLTTRESAAIQRKLVPIVTVLSAGSASVAPYTDAGARFPLDTSQFEVIDQRPFEDILGEYTARGAVIENFHPSN